MDDQEQFDTDSPATRLLDALGRGDLNALLLEFRPTTIVRTEDQSWSVQGEDEVLFWLEDAFAQFPGLVFDSHARHIGYGQVIEEARVRDIGAPPVAGEGAGAVAAAPSTGAGGGALVLDRDFGKSEGPQLNMPVRLTVLHDDAYVHEIIASYPQALLRSAMGLHVDPLDMALSEIQSAFVAPAGSGFKTYQLDKKRNIETSYAVPAPVPPARITEPEPEPEEREPVALDETWTPPPFVPQDTEDLEEEKQEGRRRALLVVPLVVLLVAGIAGGTWWLGRDDNATARPPLQTEPTKKPTDKPTKKPSSGSPSASPSNNPTKKPTEKPDVTFSSDLAFATGSSQLSLAAKSAIRDLARDIRRANLEGIIEVHGYTDNVGSNSYAIVLSRDRANAVKNYLKAALNGYDITIRAYGHGESNPVATNKTEEGRAKNRRVEITLPGDE